MLLYGPPGTGKTLSARAVANRTDACFIRVIGAWVVQECVRAWVGGELTGVVIGAWVVINRSKQSLPPHMQKTNMHLCHYGR